MRHRVRFAAVAIAVLLGVAGCTLVRRPPPRPSQLNDQPTRRGRIPRDRARPAAAAAVVHAHRHRRQGVLVRAADGRAIRRCSSSATRTARTSARRRWPTSAWRCQALPAAAAEADLRRVRDDRRQARHRAGDHDVAVELRAERARRRSSGCAARRRRSTRRRPPRTSRWPRTAGRRTRPWCCSTARTTTRGSSYLQSTNEAQQIAHDLPLVAKADRDAEPVG